MPDLHIDNNPCFDIGARLSGAIALMGESDHTETDDNLLYARRLIRDALRIATRYAEEVDEHNMTVHQHIGGNHE